MSDHQMLKTPKVLIPEFKLQARISELAHEINHDYEGKEIAAVCVLKGSFIFFSDLVRKLNMPLTCEFLGISSYGNKMVSSGEVKVTLDINDPLEGRHVLIIEDIVDSGLSLSYILNALKSRRPASVKTCCLMMKPDSVVADVDPDYIGFKVGNEFVVGYGVDFSGHYRELPYIGYLEHDH